MSYRPDTFETSSITETATIHTGPCVFGGALIGDKDGVNNMTLTLYDATSATGTEIIPTTTFDGTTKGLEGVSENHKIQCANGLHAVISGAGTLKVTVRYRKIG